MSCHVPSSACTFRPTSTFLSSVDGHCMVSGHHSFSFSSPWVLELDLDGSPSVGLMRHPSALNGRPAYPGKGVWCRCIRAQSGASSVTAECVRREHHLPAPAFLVWLAVCCCGVGSVGCRWVSWCSDHLLSSTCELRL